MSPLEKKIKTGQTYLFRRGTAEKETEGSIRVISSTPGSIIAELAGITKRGRGFKVQIGNTFIVFPDELTET